MTKTSQPFATKPTGETLLLAPFNPKAGVASTKSAKSARSRVGDSFIFLRGSVSFVNDFLERKGVVRPLFRVFHQRSEQSICDGVSTQSKIQQVPRPTQHRYLAKIDFGLRRIVCKDSTTHLQHTFEIIRAKVPRRL
jgi:hypothetical protein